MACVCTTLSPQLDTKHVPLMQNSLAAHTVPGLTAQSGPAPQRCSSVCGLTHVPAQTIWLPGQTHAPPAHTKVASHAAPGLVKQLGPAPQKLVLVWGSTQVPPQWMVVPAHAVSHVPLPMHS